MLIETLYVTMNMYCNLASAKIENIGTKTNPQRMRQCVYVCQDKSKVVQNTNPPYQCPSILIEQKHGKPNSFWKKKDG